MRIQTEAPRVDIGVPEIPVRLESRKVKFATVVSLKVGGKVIDAKAESGLTFSVEGYHRLEQIAQEHGTTAEAMLYELEFDRPMRKTRKRKEPSLFATVSLDRTPELETGLALCALPGESQEDTLNRVLFHHFADRKQGKQKEPTKGRARRRSSSPGKN